MATLFIGLCVLACPVVMLGMMRGSQRRKSDSE